MDTLYVIRHGQTEWNQALRMQGRQDSPLTSLGRLQAQVHGRTLARLGGIDTLVVSPLGRTMATAALINAYHDVPVTQEAALMERDCGAWSGLTLAEIEAAYPDDWRARGVDPYQHRPPQGENLADMRERVREFLDSLPTRPMGRVALVTHGVMSRVIVAHVLGLSPAQTVTVRHPNELFYRLELGASGRVAATHFFQGQGPRPGLLHHNEGETIEPNQASTNNN